jgi:translation initiation factor IF-2
LSNKINLYHLDKKGILTHTHSYMNISTLAKVLGISINDLRETGEKNKIYGFKGRNTRIPYQSALNITRLLKPERLSKLKNDDKIYLPAALTVSEFAETIGKPPGAIIKTLLMSGVMATLNEKIDFDTASLIAEELGVEVFAESEELANAAISGDENLSLIKTVEYDTENKTLVRRPPVVTVMGHVDHGKTTLLDTIRKANVVAGEAGAITQHISSYSLEYFPQNKDLLKADFVKGPKNGIKITFVDTPGHEAFAAMRARGSQMADFIILMVSAVEGPKPQTIEVIERAKLSKTPVIVAINKIDLPDADVERAKAEIAGFGLTPEEWGGETPFIAISAKSGTNIETLLDTILQHAELADLKGEINCPGQAIVVESHMDRSKGVESTVLVIKENLKVGDAIRCGEFAGKIKRIETTEGKSVQSAVIGDPVIIYGLPEVVGTGEAVLTYSNSAQARTDAESEKLKKHNSKRIIQNDGTQKSKDNQIFVMLKADVAGSLEAIKEAITKIPQEKVKVIIKSESLGEINESDLDFAVITQSTILAFHNRISPEIEMQIQRKKINLVQSDIIYEILNWVEEEVLRNTKYEIKVTVLGQAEVLQLFRSDDPKWQVMGGEVKEGKILASKPIRVMRGEKEIGRMEVEQLQQNKVKTDSVKEGLQFGISLSGKCKVAKGDYIQSIDETVMK